MIRGLLVDLGNVLVAFDHGITLRALARATGRSEEALREGLFGRATPAYDRGELDRQGFFRAAEEACGLDRLDDALWTAAWRDIFTPIEPALAALSRVLPGVRRVIVSNTNELHWEGVLRVARVDELVHACALSHELGLAKPDPRIFHAALSHAGCAAEEAVFADDRPDFVAAARSLGIDAFVVENEGSLAEGLGMRGLLGEGIPANERFMATRGVRSS